MIRIDYLTELLPKDLPERFFSNLAQIHQGESDLQADLLHFMDGYFQEIIQAQQDEQKEPIAYINLSFLRSAVILGNPAYQADAYNRDWYLDEKPCTMSWALASIWQYWQEDRLYLEQTVLNQSQKPRPYPYEMQWLEMKYAELYHLVAVGFLKRSIGCITELESYRAMAKDETFSIYMGEYLDQSECLFEQAASPDE